MTLSKQICSTFLRLLVHFLSILILVSNIISNIIINIGFGFIFAQLTVPFLLITKSFKRLREAFHQRKASLFQAPRQWGRRDAKVKLRHAKSWRGGKEEKFPLVLFSCSHFLNSARPTISEPGTGWGKAPGGSRGCFTKILDAGKSKFTLYSIIFISSLLLALCSVLLWCPSRRTTCAALSSLAHQFRQFWSGRFAVIATGLVFCFWSSTGVQESVIDSYHWSHMVFLLCNYRSYLGASLISVFIPLYRFLSIDRH